MPSRDHQTMEFAHKLLVNVSSLPRKGKEFDLVSDAPSRDHLAQNHGLVAVEHMHAHFHLVPQQGGRVRLDGDFVAKLVQNCVITGEAITQQISDDFHLIFIPQAQAEKEQAEIILNVEAEEEDRVEFFDGTHIDLGGVVEEFFCLALDPYPRKEGAEFTSIHIGEGDDRSPFAILKKISSANEAP